MVKDNVIVVPFARSWDWSADFPKQTCLRLANENRVVAVMHEDTIFFKDWLKGIKRVVYPEIDNIAFVRPVHPVPFQRFAWVRSLNRWLMVMWIWWRYLKGQTGLLWIFDPEFYFYVEFLREVDSLYDCADYQGRYTAAEDMLIKRWEKRLIRRADAFVVNSYALKDLHDQVRKPDAVVPQGFRYEAFRQGVPGETLSKQGPIIGYVGGINYRFDYDLLTSLVQRHPEWQFYFWGPVIDEPIELKDRVVEGVAALSEYPNVTWGLVRDRQALLSLLRQFDVCVIPYDIQFAFNRYCHPMKLFEYFYAGRPVVATPIIELKRFEEYVVIGKTVEEWEQAIAKLLATAWPKKKQQAQRRLARKNSWEEKIEAVSEAIEHYRDMSD